MGPFVQLSAAIKITLSRRHSKPLCHSLARPLARSLARPLARSACIRARKDEASQGRKGQIKGARRRLESSLTFGPCLVPKLAQSERRRRRKDADDIRAALVSLQNKFSLIAKSSLSFRPFCATFLSNSFARKEARPKPDIRPRAYCAPTAGAFFHAPTGRPSSRKLNPWRSSGDPAARVAPARAYRRWPEARSLAKVNCAPTLGPSGA